MGPFLGPWGCDCLFQPWAQTGPATLGLGEEKGSFLSVLSEVDSELSRERRTLSSSPPNGFCLFLPPYRTAAPRKDPPWITLVQAEPKKKPAPLPPSSSPRLPGRDSGRVENGGTEEVAPRSPAATGQEPKPYNPFEEEEEEVGEPPAAPSLATGPAQAHQESTPKSLHPWYGITPTSSPKTKKRLAPRAPSASPLGECSMEVLLTVGTPGVRAERGWGSVECPPGQASGVSPPIEPWS